MKIAVITGEHGFQEKQFDAVFESMEGIQFVREDLDVFVEDSDQKDYDTVVFYNFHRPYPTEAQAQAILGLAERGQGIVILHHAILAFPEWDVYSECAALAIAANSDTIHGKHSKCKSLRQPSNYRWAYRMGDG